jgi:hypothetical protein
MQNPLFMPASTPDGAAIACKVWQMLGGLDWLGLEIAAERFGVDDIEVLITQLETIRDHVESKGQ